jgi:putative endonuclease
MREHAYFTYIVASKSRTIYIGITSDLRHRIFEHKTKAHEGFTSRYNCNRLVWFEQSNDVNAAIEREKELKGWLRSRKTSAGSLLHSGALIFDAQSNATKVRLQAFVISTASKPPMLSAEIVVNGSVWGRYNVFDLALPAGTTLPLKPSGNTLMLKGVKLTLDPSMSAMLNKVYGVSQFTPGFDVGTANVTANIDSNNQ